eukprot:TRINITY_DN16988_c0_g1_i1.p1 TRINITY_DN16988_c0_g1~~TRINITY_DN16988_c0_g1_i1.p1  ORF type:complete len:530 (-),score=82.93 TRINITY_DN16988_c0_g1_i1:190-1779(-)
MVRRTPTGPLWLPDGCKGCEAPIYSSEASANLGFCTFCHRLNVLRQGSHGDAATSSTFSADDCRPPPLLSTDSVSTSSDGSNRKADTSTVDDAGKLRARHPGPSEMFRYNVGQVVLCQSHLTDRIEAEIVACKVQGGAPWYYVHFVGADRRLDHWVVQDLLRPAPQDDDVEPPAKRLRTVTYPIPIVDPQTVALERANAEEERRWVATTRVKNFQSVQIGPHLLDAWYFSPYPEDHTRGVATLLICEFCLKYFRTKRGLHSHREQCPITHPPGAEIYRNGDFSVFEVDGKDERVYCQLLCLLAKLFLDHKTLYYDVEPFLFYVLVGRGPDGYQLRGYFSKEKQSDERYNLSCIMVFPPFQKEGYGRFLIQLSYELSKREGRPGKPERPLSDLGLRGYMGFWKYTVLASLVDMLDAESMISIQDIARCTAIHPDDVLLTLNHLKLLTYDPAAGRHVGRFGLEALRKFLADLPAPRRVVRSELLKWVPSTKQRGRPTKASRFGLGYLRRGLTASNSSSMGTTPPESPPVQH